MISRPIESMICALALALSSAAAHGGRNAEERSAVIKTDSIVEGISWPGGSTLIHRRGFVRGCRSADGFCLSEVKLSRDANLCGVPVPKAAEVLVDYVRADDRPDAERGVFLLVRGAERFTLDGVALRFLVTVRCDAPPKETRLRGGQLDEEHTFGRETLKPGVWFELYPPAKGGGLAEAWFKQPATFHTIALPKESMVNFAPDGTVTSYHNYESADIPIQGVSCHVGFSMYARVYPSGKLESCEIWAAQRIGPLTASYATTFYESGAIATTTLGKDLVLHGKSLHAGQKIKLGPGGELLKAE